MTIASSFCSYWIFRLEEPEEFKLHEHKPNFLDEHEQDVTLSGGFDVLPCFAFAHAHQLVKIRGFYQFPIKLRDATSCEIKTNGFHVENL